MKIVRALIVVLGMAALLTEPGTLAVVQMPSSIQSKRLIKLVPGEYLRSDYVEALARTQSPLQSDVFDAPQLVKVREGKTGLLLQVVFNFHEGGAEFILQENGSIHVQLAGLDTSNVSATVIDTHHFELGFDEFKPSTYIFVGSASRYAAAKVLVGIYKDDKGRRYVFGTDGWATFPDRKFKYRLGLDHVLNRYDYFVDSKSSKVLAFKKQKNILEIFGTKGEIDQDVDERPMYELRQIPSLGAAQK